MTGMEVLVNCAGGLGASAVAGAARRVYRYCLEFNTLDEGLGDERELLKSVREEMQDQIRKAKANSREPRKAIVQQLNKAADLLEKARTLQEKAEGSFGRCDGVLPYLICRCIVGRQMEKITNKMERITDYFEPHLETFNRLPLQAVSLPEEFVFFETTVKACNEIVTALNDNTKKKIGLYGMGGCGKSSMLKQVHKEAQDRNLFDKIAFVEVSETLNILDIQQAIADWFSLDLGTETDKNARAAKLSKAFEEDTSYLIILDNVWKMLKFDDIGILFHKNCKVLLSTRQRGKCKLMGCQEVIHLPLLTDEEAWELFQKYAGEIKERFKKGAENITKDDCQGLPVALKPWPVV